MPSQVAQIAVACPARVMNDLDLGDQLDKKSFAMQPCTGINVLVIQEKPLIEATNLPERICSPKHKHACNPVRLNRCLPDRIFRTSLAKYCLARDAQRCREQTSTVFNLPLRPGHQRCNHPYSRVCQPGDQLRKWIALKPDIRILNTKIVTLGDLERCVMICSKSAAILISDYLDRERKICSIKRQLLLNIQCQ